MNEAPLPTERMTAAEQVFDRLHMQILTLELPPGTRMSETETGLQFGLSRQPVRDAFFRLAQLGFLLIRPQRATIVSPISVEAVMRAHFIRRALELETLRSACRVLSDEDHRALRAIVEDQRIAMEAGDKRGFHHHDDAMHREICQRAGLGFIWDEIRLRKAHIDRVRFLSLSFASQRAYDEHLALLDAIEDRDEDRAIAVMREHLSQIRTLLARIRAENEGLFLPGEAMPEVI